MKWKNIKDESCKEMNNLNLTCTVIICGICDVGVTLHCISCELHSSNKHPESKKSFSGIHASCLLWEDFQLAHSAVQMKGGGGKKEANWRNCKCYLRGALVLTFFKSISIKKAHFLGRPPTKGGVHKTHLTGCLLGFPPPSYGAML